MQLIRSHASEYLIHKADRINVKLDTKYQVHIKIPG